MKKILFLILLFCCFLPLGVFASEKQINLYLFYGKECPHCEAEMKFLDEFMKKHENVKLTKYEVWYDKDNQDLFARAKEIMDYPSTGIPYLIIGEDVIVGYSEAYTKKTIEDRIKYYEKNNYRDLFGEEMGYVEKDTSNNLDANTNFKFNIPILGEIDAKSVSLPLIAIIMGFVDGFNPCAMWVLIFLISMLFGMKNKKRMWILGLAFIITSGLVYLGFMLSWFNLTNVISEVLLLRALVGLFAVVFGSINLYRYYKSIITKEVGCDVTSKKQRISIMNRITKIVKYDKFVFSVLGIMLLAISVNLIELMCSLGLPVMFTQILSLNNLNTLNYVVYMGLYILFFLLDDIVIFAIAVKTSEIKAISNKYTKYSHLIGGVIMLLIGVLMIFKPEWLMFNF